MQMNDKFLREKVLSQSIKGVEFRRAALFYIETALKMSRLAHSNELAPNCSDWHAQMFGHIKCKNHSDGEEFIEEEMESFMRPNFIA